MAKAQREDTAPAHEIKYVVAEDTARGQFHQGGLVRKEFCRLLIGPIGCVSGDTEFLSPTGWKRIDEWDGEDIAQWSPDGYLSWVKPEYHRGPATEPLYRFHKDHMSMVLSGEHRVPVYDWDGKFAVKTAERLAAKRSRHTLPTTFTVPQTGPLCSEWWVRLLVAMEADGSRPKAGRQSIFTFRKERKKERIEWLLNLNGLSWKKREYPQRPTETTYVVQTRLPKTRYTDRFWWGLSSTELEWVVDEMVHWDGHRSSHTFFSSGHKCAVDFMQFAAHATGRKATIRAIQPRKGNEKVHYTAIVSEKGGVKSRTQVRSDDPPIERVPCAEQFCFTVPTSFWLARHNGFVFATGNSGKSVASIMDFFMLASSMPKLRDGFRHSRWAFIRNTGPQLRDTTLKTYMDWFPEPQFGQFRRTEKIFNFQYGDVKAEILFKALDDPGDVRNLLSLELTGAFLNEAREIDPSIWEGVTGRVGRYPSFAKLKQVLPWSHEPPDRPGRWLRWSRKKHNAPSRVTEHYVRLTDGVLTADVDLVRDLDYKWAEGPWAGIIADTNPCSTDDFIYKLFEVQAKQDPQVGELYHIYHQPPGLLRADNRWVTNPNAENIENLPPGYYTKAAVGKDKSWIDVYCLGKYGVLSDGKPVHAGYDDSWHCCEFDFDPSLPVYVGWDFGITGQACVLAQLSRRGQLRVFDEFFAEDVGMYSFARDVVKPGLAKWKGAKFEMSFGDPAGNNRSASDEKAAMEVLNDAYEGLEVRLPFKTYPTHTNAARPRWDAVDFFLNNNTLKQAQEPVAPRFLIHPRCTLLRQGLQGRYEFERVRGTDGRYKEVPKKNRHSHLADALQYLCLGTISHNDWRPENEREDEDDAMPVRRVARTASYSGY